MPRSPRPSAVATVRSRFRRILRQQSRRRPLRVRARPSVRTESEVASWAVAGPGKDERIRLLVEMLASKNPAPKLDYGRLIVPAGFDREAQAVVYFALQQLLAEGEVPFDTLISHFDDDRYSLSFSGIQGQGNLDVGGVALC